MNTRVATLGVITSSVMMGMVPLFARALTDVGLSSISVSFYRNFVGTLVLATLIRLDRERRTATLWALATGLGMGLGWASYVSAVQVVSVSTAGVIYMSYPLFAIVLAWLLFGQRPAARAVLSGGIVLAASIVAVGSSLDGSNARILLVAFAAPLSFGFAVAVLTERLAALRPLERVAPVAAGSSIGLLPIMATQTTSESIPPDLTTWALVGGFAVLTAIGPQWIYVTSAPHVGPARAAVAGSVELPTMFLVGWLWFNEEITANQWIAGVMVVAAVLLVPSRQSPGLSIVRRRRRLIPGRVYTEPAESTRYGDDMTAGESFDLDTLVSELRAAAVEPDAATQVEALLRTAVADPAAVQAAIPEFEDDDVILFEDETVSIWHCRFPPGLTVPPHDHQMTATIAVYDGVEQNNFFTTSEDGALEATEELQVGPGEVVQLTGERIHGVTCAGDGPSRALHVYLGKLTAVDRSLFDPVTGTAMPMTDESYGRLSSS